MYYSLIALKGGYIGDYFADWGLLREILGVLTIARMGVLWDIP